MRLTTSRTALPLLALAGVIACSAGPAPVTDVAPGHAAARLLFVYPPLKVLKGDALQTAADGREIRLSAAAGEIEPFLVVVRPRGARPLLDVRFEWSDLRADNGSAIPRSALQAFRLAYHRIGRPSGWSVFDRDKPRFPDAGKPFGVLGRTGDFPDAILPVRPREVAEIDGNTQFWFELGIPANASPGVYRAELTVHARGIEPIPIALLLRVYGFALPEFSGLQNTACWSPQEWPDKPDEQTLRAIYREFARARQVPDPILPQPEVQVTAEGEIRIDSAAYEKMLAYCLDELQMPHFFFPRVGGAWYTNVYFLWHTPQVAKERWQGVPIFTPRLESTPEFRQVFTSYLRQMSERLRRRGWLKKALITSMDEPHTAEDFKAIRAYAAAVKEAAPDLRRFCTTYPRPELEGAIDVWCPQQYDEPAVKARQAAGEQLMFYKNWLMLIDEPMVNPRLLGWIAWRTGAVGWLTYATMGRWNRAWEDPCAIYPNTGIRAWGLGLLFYPQPMHPRLLRSVRWEMMREGAEDWEYLNLLRQRLARLPPARDGSPAAIGAQRFLDSAAERVILSPHIIPAGETDEWTSRPAYVTSHATVFQVRNEAAAWIERLAGTGD